MTVSTETGLTNAGVTLMATYGGIVLDIPAGREYRSDASAAFSFRTTAHSTDPSAWSTHVFQGGGRLYGRDHIYLGDSTGSQGWNNQLLVKGGSTLACGFDIYVGDSGQSNVLTVTDASKAWAGRDFIVGAHPSWGGTNNVAIFSGKNVELRFAAERNGNISVGICGGMGNQLIFEDGAICTNGAGAGAICIGTVAPTGGASAPVVTYSNGCYNVIIVRNGAYLKGAGSLAVGGAEDGNSLVVSNAVADFVAANQKVSLGVLQGSSNSIVVLDGGKFTYPDIEMALRPEGKSSLILVDGTNSIVSGSWISLRRGSDNLISVTRGAKIAASNIRIGYHESLSGGSGSRVVADGTNSTIEVGGTVSVGMYLESSRNVVVSTNSAFVKAPTLHVGCEDGTWSNEVVVADKAVLQSTTISIGRHANAHYNGLVVSDGGTVTNSGAFAVGNNGAKNYAKVTRGGTLVVQGESNIGYTVPTATENWMEISEGGKVYAQNLFLNGGGESKLFVRGVNSELRCATLAGGQNWHSNRVEITDGGAVHATGNVTIGNTTLSSNNVMVVSNGTVTTKNLYLRYEGTLTIAGTTSAVTVTNLLEIATGTALEYEFGKVAPAAGQPLIDATKVVAGSSIGTGAALKVDGRKLALAGGAKDIVLLRVGTSPYVLNLDYLTANFTPTDGESVRVYISPDGTVRELRCDVPNKSGTVILLR